MELKKTSTENENIRALRRAKIKEWLCIWSFLIIPLINLCIFWVYGTIQSFPIAFEHKFIDGTLKYDFSNFEYLIKTLSEPENKFGEAFVNTLIYWLLGFAFMMPFGFLMAFFLYKKIFGFKFFRFVFFFPSIISSVIIAAFFKYIFGRGGQMPYLWEQIFGVKVTSFFVDSKYAFKTLLFYNLYHGLTGQLLYWLAAYVRIPEEI
ncbi:MAG: sugar ABC transporter permease, partial [Clostridia bacterium]|nr:sugar ABC transporter permease [Clostridia bacterium]